MCFADGREPSVSPHPLRGSRLQWMFAPFGDVLREVGIALPRVRHAHPRTGCFRFIRPQGGRTTARTGTARPWMFAPFGDVLGRWGLLFRGFAMLTRGYRVVRPPWGRIPHGRHTVVPRVASRTAGTSSCHGSHSARPVHRRVTGRIPARPVHRRAVSRTPHGLTGQTAPKGSHYSVAVGERSEPAEGGPPIIIGPKGVEHTVHAGRSDGDVRPLWGRTREVGAASRTAHRRVTGRIPHGRCIVVPWAASRTASPADGPEGVALLCSRG